MKKVFYAFFLFMLTFSFVFSQSTLWQCEMQTSGAGTETQLVNVTQPLVMIYVDFADGRLANGNAPTVDTEAMPF